MKLGDYKGYIFDFDGVIMDTEKYHYLAWYEGFKYVNMTLNHDDYEKLKSNSPQVIIDTVMELNHRTLTISERLDIVDTKNRVYQSFSEQLSSSDFIPGMLDFLEFLKRNQKLIGCVSSSIAARKLLEKFNIDHFFDVILDGNDDFKRKPSPDGYLKAMHLLHLNKEEVVIFEDSLIGLKAAKDTEAHVVYVGPLKEVQAHAKINDFNGLKL